MVRTAPAGGVFSEDTVAAVAGTLAAHGEVVCAYVFGSVLHSPAVARDLDIGVYIDLTMTGGDILPSAVRIYDSLKRALGRTDIDVSPLNDSSHALRHEVIAKGACVYSRCESERVDFETMSELAYYDFLPMQRMFDESTWRHIREYY